MKIKMLVGLAGVDFALSPNDVTDRFPIDEAKRLIDAGFAVPATESVVEMAAKPQAPERRGKEPKAR